MEIKEIDEEARRIQGVILQLNEKAQATFLWSLMGVVQASDPQLIINAANWTICTEVNLAVKKNAVGQAQETNS